MRLRETADPTEMLSIAWQLREHLPQLRDNEMFLHSIPHFLQSEVYKFFVVEDDPSDDFSEPYAFGLLRFYQEPMAVRVVLAVEALWFADEQLENQLWIWAAITSIAKRMKFYSVCISEQSVNTPTALGDLLKRGELNGNPVGKGDTLLQGAMEGIYSAFIENPSSAAFIATCYRIFTGREAFDFEGVCSYSPEPLYRGEGRVKKSPYENCENAEELIKEIFSTGFTARGNGDFSGNVQQQILQQGYVKQPTVSFTESFDVAAYYATDKHNPERERAVVFTVDRGRLRRGGAVYDSYATMKKHCYWVVKHEFDTLVGIVKALGVLNAGSFLSRANDETRRIVESGGSYSLADTPNWIDEYVGEDVWEELRHAGVKEEQLRSLFGTFEAFWMLVLGIFATVDTLVLGETDQPSEVLSKPERNFGDVGPFGYYLAFSEVQAELKAALDEKLREAALQGKAVEYRHPGWDLTPFGYIAKTCRDQEFFSTGPVPGNCITKATIVNSHGFPLQTIINDSAANR